MEENEVETANKEKLSGVALSINVGNYHDYTVSVPGMAHFLEHMVFMGSEKYPEENYFEKYLNVRLIFRVSHPSLIFSSIAE